MNCLRNPRSVLSRVLPRKPTAVRPPRPRPAQAPSARYYHASGGNAASRSPSSQVQSHWGLFDVIAEWRERSPFFRTITSPRVVVVGGGALAIYLSNLEPVPYTNRAQFIILPLKLELRLGELVLDEIKKEMKSDRVLPPHHPESVRVRRIASEIVGAVDRGLADHRRHKRRPVMLGAFPREEAGAGAVARLDEEALLGAKQQPQTSSRLLDGWEVIVVKNKEINAMCAPGGKIIVYTGLLDKFREDAEVATVLGHEVGHAIARHGAEICTKLLMRLILHVVTLKFMYRPGLKRALSMSPLFQRRLETEADHIGLLLLAAAGYDPRAGPLVYEKMGKLVRDRRSTANKEDTHPSARERVRFLSRADIMNEALELYRGVRSSS